MADDQAPHSTATGSEAKKSQRFKAWLTAWLVFLIFRLLRATWRIENNAFEGAPGVERKQYPNKPVIVAHFHEDEWALLGLFAYQNMHALVSLSNDGSVMSRFLEKIGFRITRGSSSRGAVAGLLGVIRSMRRTRGKILSMAVDGPRGPRRRAKKGVFKVAEALDAPIMAVAATADRAWVFKKSWSRAFIPKPFARVRIVGHAFESSEAVKKLAKRDDLAELCYGLEEKLRNAKSLAKKELKA